MLPIVRLRLSRAWPPSLFVRSFLSLTWIGAGSVCFFQTIRTGKCQVFRLHILSPPNVLTDTPLQKARWRQVRGSSRMRPEKFAGENTEKHTCGRCIHLAGSQNCKRCIHFGSQPISRGHAHARVVAAGIGAARRHQLNVK
jgi:hypothetical protein